MTVRGPVKTTCPYCGVGCGLVAAADGTIAGDPEHPANRGRLCSKGAALAETLGDKGRLLYPQIGGKRVRWDEALDLIARRLGETVAAHGPDAVAFYVSGQFLTEDYYVANKLMKGFIGSGNIDTNSRLCMASSVTGHIRAFGEDIVPGCYEDIEQADLVVVVGSNMAWCHPVLYQRLAAAKEERGARIVVVDPRRTATCEIADLHLALRPGSDVVLFAGLLTHLADHDACHRAWIEGFTTGFAEALSAARHTAPSLEAVTTLTDLPVADLGRFYEWFSAAERTVTLYSQGVNQSSAGTDKVNAIINCHLATGRIGRPGMGPLSLTGQPNAMGGREVGGMANQLAAHAGFTDDAIDRVRRFWDAPRLATRPGLKAVDLFDAVRDGGVKALWVLGTNPAVSMPRAARVRAALAACPFVVVSDCWPTDTTRLADLVLPAAGWGEKDGTVTNSERRISRQRAFHVPPGEARPDWWALCEVARRMGFGSAFRYRGPGDIFREHAALSSFENDGRRLFDIGALADLSDEAYERLQPIQWPAPLTSRFGTKRLFTGPPRFPADDGRARFVATPYRAPAQPVGAEWPLVLNTGRTRDQWHTMTRTGLAPRLMTHQREPQVDLHPEDAERLGVSDGDLVAVDSPHGRLVLPARLSAAQRPGEVFAPMHWSDQHSSAGPVDRLIGAATDPVSGQPELKAATVGVTRMSTHWRGLLLRPELGTLSGSFYWSRIPLDAGEAVTLAGWKPLPTGNPSLAWIRELLGATAEAELIIYADPHRGVFRYASVSAERLQACLLLARHAADLPDATALAAALGRDVTPDARLVLLAGCAGGQASSAERTVCACLSVGLRTLHSTIVERRLSSVTEIGKILGAGTNCGSCIPELKAILHSLNGEAHAPPP